MGAGDDVFAGVTFSLEEGEVVGPLGRNGAGKTTLIHIAMGMIRARGGSVRLVHSGVVGDVTWYATGTKRHALVQDPGAFGRIQVIVDEAHGWTDVPPGIREEQHGRVLTRLREGHPGAGGEKRRRPTCSRRGKQGRLCPDRGPAADPGCGARVGRSSPIRSTKR